ncbi:MAG TPA: LysR family transcriptional regulator [Clostridiales bacterium]|jgi:DNA-binding transcriptional LysR family regulator|nr:LysR family transcriptional regulator [Clostridiales bacterium]
MNERELLYVKTIADTQSISKASKKLFVAQPSLSQALQKIEDRLGTPLFIRYPNGVKLTLAGEKYYRAATAILKIYDELCNEITEINNLKKGKITIGITNYLAVYLLPKILPKFHEKWPNIEIYIHEDNSYNIEDLLMKGSLDFGIMHYESDDDNRSLKYEALCEDMFVLVTKCNHPMAKYAEKVEGLPYPVIDLHLFENENFVLLERDKRIRQICDSIFDELNFKPKIGLLLRNYETARRLASVGFGVTCIPFGYINISKGEYEADYYFIKGNIKPAWKTCVVINPKNYLSKAARVFIDLVKEYYKTNQLTT